MDLGLRGRTALVTGGASGIGLAVGRALADEGASVILVDARADTLSAAASDLGTGVNALQADLRDPAQVRGLQETVRERFAMPDILVCTDSPAGTTGHLLQLRDAEWQDAWERGLLSVVRVLRCFLPEMERRGWGRAVIVTGPDIGQPGEAGGAGGVLRSGPIALARGLSRGGARNGVLVNGLCVAGLPEASKTGDDARRPALDTVAATIAFLCSDRAGILDGATCRPGDGAGQAARD